MIRILLADDHPVVRTGLRAVFAAEDDMEVVGEAGSVEDALAACERLQPHVVLMDLQFGADRSALQGVDATRIIRERPDAPHVLVLTNYDTDADILGAVEAGASGYLLKDAPPTELLAAVRSAAAGRSALAPAVEARLSSRSRSSRPGLSTREAEVLTLVAEGRSNRDIGRELFLSEATVKSHLVHIFTKLDAGSRTSAVAKAREIGAIRG
ncbi:LuxR family two component transcriptional regulator [Homoserinimonas aerilata]|uniref:LuxR family two component transcriptional regulator n=1 Tax=Homoserinimonas aerilata TaxID=1162970 RepID=A0A542YHX8_9MICO|nr:response regulator transcription factor [Homoserinimonas aerilata]TQL47621.1 LuxR family two component transcriptional regulator [Homoserinimonas aerilata]